MIHIDCSREPLNFSQYDLSKDEIFVIDNLFPWWFIHHMDKTILHGFGWQYGLCSGHKSKQDGTPDWDYDKGADFEFEVPCFKQSIYPPKSESSGDSAYEMLYNAIVGSINFDLELGEVLVNGQQYIHDTTIHQDCSCDNGLSWIYYVNKRWEPEWGGPTIIEHNGESVEILPKPGRVCFFKGNIPHRGAPPNGEYYRGLRATLVYKTMRTDPLPNKK
tara:strand:+ start:16534 stop:17187 length:654 start_codon:yes stop_codon:yes gene_type:complete